MIRSFLATRRAQREAEVARLAFLLATVRSENARRMAELSAPCIWCLADLAEGEVSE